jgi:tripeptidyl-peptidase-1
MLYPLVDFNFKGARGVSLLFASGDFGVGAGDAGSDPTNRTCFTNDGQNKTTFIPTFPAS